MTLEELLALLARFSQRVDNLTLESINRQIAAYRLIDSRIADKIQLLVNKINGQKLTVNQIKRLPEYSKLMTLLNDELTRYSGFLQTELLGGLDSVIGFANNDNLMFAKLQGFRGSLKILSPAAIVGLLKSIHDRVFDGINELPSYVAEKVAMMILEQGALGIDPLLLASKIRDALGWGLTSSMRTSRTFYNWSYREAQRATWLANPDFYLGWYWVSAKSPTTCMSCLAMDGTFHGNNEVLDDHYNGWCEAVPATMIDDNPLRDYQTGEEWLNSLTEEQQRQIMGDKKYELWSAGKLSMSDFSKQVDDPVYGSMRVETPVGELE